MVTADFNHDGNADLVTATSNNGTLTLLLGDGAGHFVQAPGGPITPPSVVLGPIAAGDFNGDGNPDVVLTGGAGNAILLGDGKGNLVPGSVVSSSIKIGGKFIAVGDYNGDGKLDFITAGSGFNYLWLGDGTGAFLSPKSVILNTTYPIEAFVSGDFNGDGKLDVAALDPFQTGYLSVSLGDGNGGFQWVFHQSTPYQGSFGPQLYFQPPLTSGDFNGDGKADILTFLSGVAETWLWTGNTSTLQSAFAPTGGSSVPLLPDAVVTADFNGDGKLDWAGVNTQTGAVIVFLGNGTGGFTAAPGSPYTVGGAPFAIVAGDWNGDGRQDLAVDTGSSVVILLNSATDAAAPEITEVDNAFSNAPKSPIQSGSWVAIKGTHLSNTSPGRGWNTSETFPTTMDGTSVTIDGKPAFLYYISPTQINVQAPTDSVLGSVTVAVNNNGLGAATTAIYATDAPAFLQWGGGQYPYALISRGTDYIGNPAVVPSTVSAHAGDTLTLWATGLGTTVPAVPAGQQPDTFPPVQTLPVVTAGGSPVTVLGAVLRYAGLYQINVQLPASLPAGDLALKISQSGTQSRDGVLIHIQ